MKSKTVIIFVTAASEQEAASIGKHLVEEGLAACANIIPQIRSIYRWKGDICDESESLILIKSRADLFEKIRSRIRELHSYEVPEITAISLEKGDADYLQWIETATGKGD
ncbi:MAG: divalent-cation tolerance protein CutA [Deltaproteobacteria bacterium]|nr:divalent-cation tolerance protein CutA [Deltaproteobacteria bacterium]